MVSDPRVVRLNDCRKVEMILSGLKSLEFQINFPQLIMKVDFIGLSLGTV